MDFIIIGAHGREGGSFMHEERGVVYNTESWDGIGENYAGCLNTSLWFSIQSFGGV